MAARIITAVLVAALMAFGISRVVRSRRSSEPGEPTLASNSSIPVPEGRPALTPTS